MSRSSVKAVALKTKPHSYARKTFGWCAPNALGANIALRLILILRIRSEIPRIWKVEVWIISDIKSFRLTARLNISSFLY